MMRVSFLLCGLGTVLCLLSSAAAQEGRTAGRLPPDPAYDAPAPASQSPAEAARVSLVRDPGGRQVLIVAYPWKVHARPSVEVRLLSPGEADDERVQPMYFRWKHMKGDTTAAVYRCQDRCDDAPVRAAVPVGDEELEVLGQRNSLGKPAVAVARWTNTDPKVRLEPGAAAAFPLLDAWSVDEKLLYLDLPDDYFAAPGAVRVWLMRDDRVVWSEKLEWPGSGKAAKKRAAKPAPKAEPAPAGAEGPTPAKPRPKPAAKPKPKPKAEGPDEEEKEEP